MDATRLALCCLLAFGSLSLEQAQAWDSDSTFICGSEKAQDEDSSIEGGLADLNLETDLQDNGDGTWTAWTFDQIADPSSEGFDTMMSEDAETYYCILSEF